MEAGLSWTEERVALLRRLWEDGQSASKIAAQLGGVTRNAVIGKVHRLGLAGRVKSGEDAPVVASKPLRWRRPRSWPPRRNRLSSSRTARLPNFRRPPRLLRSPPRLPNRLRSPCRNGSRSWTCGNPCAVGRWAIRPRRNSASAAPGRSPACPIARTTPKSPTNRRQSASATAGRRLPLKLRLGQVTPRSGMQSGLRQEAVEQVWVALAALCVAGAHLSVCSSEGLHDPVAGLGREVRPCEDEAPRTDGRDRSVLPRKLPAGTVIRFSDDPRRQLVDRVGRGPEKAGTALPRATARNPGHPNPPPHRAAARPSRTMAGPSPA